MSYCDLVIQREEKHIVLGAIFNKTYPDLYSVIESILPYETQPLPIPGHLIGRGVFNQLKEDILCNL